MTGTVAVTGAAGSLGAKTAEVLTRAGWKVAGLDLASAPMDNVALALGGVDLTDEAAVGAAAKRIEAELGGLDGLVNVAGGFTWETLADGSVESWDRLYAMNVKTAVVTTRAMLPMLRAAKGAIVNVGAAAAVKAPMGMGPYAASKAGVGRLTEALAEEHKSEGLRVNAVLPSIIDTAPNRKDMPDADFSAWVSPEELANVIAFLLSPAASAVTGALIPVTGRV